MNKNILISIITTAFLLTACAATKSYDREVELTDEKRTEYEDRIAKAEEEIEAFYELNPEADGINIATMEQYTEKANVLQKLGRVDEAIATYKQALEEYGPHTVLWNNLAKIYHFEGDCEKAEEYYYNIITTFENKEYYYDIALCYMRYDKDYEKTKDAYQNYLEAFPNGADGEIIDFLSANKS